MFKWRMCMDTRRIKVFITSLYHWLIKIVKNVFSLTGITCICLFIFSITITWFYYILASVKMDLIECIWFKDKWRNTILGLGTVTVFAFDCIGVKSHLQKQVQWCFKGVISLTYLLVMGVYFGKIPNPYPYFLSLNIGVFTSTGMILISGARHNALID